MGKRSKFDGEMKQIGGEMKQNVLGRCPKGKVRIHLSDMVESGTPGISKISDRKKWAIVGIFLLQTDIESKGAKEIMKVPMKLNFRKGCLFL